MILVIRNSAHEGIWDCLLRYGPVRCVWCNDLSGADLSATLADVSVLLLTGGPQHCPHLSDYPELQWELQLLDCAIQRGITVIGICLGFQLINLYYGNPVVTMERPIIGHGYLDVSSGTLRRGFSFHYDGIPVNRSAALIADYSIPVGSDRTRWVYRIRDRCRPVFGIQSHPEATADGISSCLERYGCRQDVLLDEAVYATIFREFLEGFCGVSSK